MYKWNCVFIFLCLLVTSCASNLLSDDPLQCMVNNQPAVGNLSDWRLMTREDATDWIMSRIIVQDDSYQALEIRRALDTISSTTDTLIVAGSGINSTGKLLKFIPNNNFVYTRLAEQNEFPDLDPTGVVTIKTACELHY